MSSYNLGLAFYRKYYEDWNFETDMAKSGLSPDVVYPRDVNDANEKEKEKMQQSYFAFKSKQLKSQTLPNPSLFRYSDKSVNKTIQLKTTYPGLLLGSGYAHGIGKKQGEHKIGFYFDHTTGLPTIPGSSVKGTLRSVFPLRYAEKAENLEKKGKKEKADAYKEEAKNRTDYLIYLIANELKLKPSDLVTPNWISQLEREIFDGIYEFDKRNKPQLIPSRFRDVFYDAIPVSPTNKAILGDDFITPHKNTSGDGVPDALKNPNPIQFLKVLPGVTFSFQFQLFDNYILLDQKTRELEERDRLLNGEERRTLFKNILEHIGIGAKTNVGYGQFTDVNS
jgi:CRISPR-associated protein Cmr6